jgi:hypothetical protein
MVSRGQESLAARPAPEFGHSFAITTWTLFPARLDDDIGEDNPVQAVDGFVDEPSLDEGRV